MTRKFFTLAFLSAASINGLATAPHVSACDRRVVYYQQTPAVIHPSPVRVVYPALQPIGYIVEKPVVPTIQVVDKRPEVPTGSTITTRALFLGNEKGFVFLKHGHVAHRCVIHNWTPESVTFTVPQLDIQDEVAARVELVRPDGNVVKKIDIRLFSEGDFFQVVSPAIPGTLAIQPAPAPASAEATTINVIAR